MGKFYFFPVTVSSCRLKEMYNLEVKNEQLKGTSLRVRRLQFQVQLCCLVAAGLEQVTELLSLIAKMKDLD